MNLKEIQNLVHRDGIIFLSYGGFLSQALISAMTEALEKETDANDIEMGISSNIFTIFIELSQNMMNYSKSKEKNSNEIVPEGIILVSKDMEGNYSIQSQNVVTLKDKEKIEPKLLNVQSLDNDGLRKQYRELRKSGKNRHEKGGGIGFYEIAKRCDNIEYNFQKINEDRYYFQIKTNINKKRKII